MIDGAILEANVILLRMYDVDMILRMDWLSNHRPLRDFSTKKIVVRKSDYLELEIEDDRRIFTYVCDSALEAKRLLHKGCKAYLAHVIDKSSSKVTLNNVPIVCEFLDVFIRSTPR